MVSVMRAALVVRERSWATERFTRYREFLRVSSGPGLDTPSHPQTSTTPHHSDHDYFSSSASLATNRITLAVVVLPSILISFKAFS